MSRYIEIRDEMVALADKARVYHRETFVPSIKKIEMETSEEFNNYFDLSSHSLKLQVRYGGRENSHEAIVNADLEGKRFSILRFSPDSLRPVIEGSVKNEPEEVYKLRLMLLRELDTHPQYEDTFLHSAITRFFGKIIDAYKLKKEENKEYLKLQKEDNELIANQKINAITKIANADLGSTVIYDLYGSTHECVIDKEVSYPYDFQIKIKGNSRGVSSSRLPTAKRLFILRFIDHTFKGSLMDYTKSDQK